MLFLLLTVSSSSRVGPLAAAPSDSTRLGSRLSLSESKPPLPPTPKLLQVTIFPQSLCVYVLGIFVRSSLVFCLVTEKTKEQEIFRVKSWFFFWYLKYMRKLASTRRKTVVCSIEWIYRFPRFPNNGEFEFQSFWFLLFYPYICSNQRRLEIEISELNDLFII